MPAETLVDLLRETAAATPDKGYSFLGDGRAVSERMTFADLDRSARAIAAGLHAEGIRPGARLLLLYPPGLDFVRAFFGVLYAGCITVPVPPPNPARLERTLPRLRAIAADCEVEQVVTTADFEQMAAGMLSMAPELAVRKWLATDRKDVGDPDAWKRPTRGADDVALLQYTSGSTGTPRGVQISNANLLENLNAIVNVQFGPPADYRLLTWLPVFHDMGLIGGMLSPVFARGECFMMSPLQFLQDPICWLESVKLHRATIVGGPNFAYELCARRATDDQVATLDLSTLEVASCGAEPIRQTTVDAFAKRFGPAGFRRAAFRPCYGLAEATLLVTAVHDKAGPRIWSVNQEAMLEGEIKLSDAADAYPLVGCGEAIGCEVLIVDDQGERCDGARIGEVWVRGPSVGKGYWNKEEATRETFGARLADGSGPYLRTGDLGWLSPTGELCIAGRRKDLIIVRGRNYHPHDIEATIEAAAPKLRKGGSAVFALTGDDSEAVAAVVEYDTRNVNVADVKWTEVVDAIRSAVGEEHEIPLQAVRLLPPGQLPKTPSGKVQRSLARRMHQNDELETLHLWTAPIAKQIVVEKGAGPRTEDDIATFLTSWISESLGREVSPDAGFASLGLDSLEVVKLVEALRIFVNRPKLSASAALDHPNIRALAAHVASTQGASVGIEPPPLVRTPIASGSVASYWQESTLAWERARSPSPTWTETLRLRLRGKLDVQEMIASFRGMIERQEALRQTFPREPGGPCRLCDVDDVPVSELDVPLEELETALHEIVHTLFDLDGPLVRFYVLRHGDEDHTVVVRWHQMVHDALGAPMVGQELLEGYAARVEKRPSFLPELPVRFVDYAAWERAWYEGAGHAQVVEARKRLAGAKPLELPTDRPRTGKALSPLAVTTVIALTREQSDHFAEVCRSLDVTFFSGIVAVVSVALARWCKTDDVIFVAPVSTRGREETRFVFGRFGAWVPFRVSLAGDPTWRQLFERAGKQSAVGNELVPGPLLYEASSVFDHPLNRVVLNNPQIDPMPEGVTVAGLGVSTGPILKVRCARNELSFVVARQKGRLYVRLEAAADLFDPGTVARWTSELSALFLAVDPGASVLGRG